MPLRFLLLPGHAHKYGLRLPGRAPKNPTLHGAIPKITAGVKAQISLVGPSAVGGVYTNPNAIQPHFTPGMARALAFGKSVYIAGCQTGTTGQRQVDVGEILANALAGTKGFGCRCRYASGTAGIVHMVVDRLG